MGRKPGFSRVLFLSPNPVADIEAEIGESLRPFYASIPALRKLSPETGLVSTAARLRAS